MASPKGISFLAGILLLGYSLSYIMGGAWFDESSQSLFGSLTILKTYTILWAFKLPWVNWDFFTVGLPSLVSFNFAFFGGELAYLKYGLYVLSIGIIWGVVAAVVSVIAGFWGKMNIL